MQMFVRQSVQKEKALIWTVNIFFIDILTIGRQHIQCFHPAKPQLITYQSLLCAHCMLYIYIDSVMTVKLDKFYDIHSLSQAIQQ